MLDIHVEQQWSLQVIQLLMLNQLGASTGSAWRS